MSVREKMATLLLRSALRIVCRVDDSEIARLPLAGPLIVAMNHINFLEVPLIQTVLMPRRVVGFVKHETWRNPIMRYFLNTYGAIPVVREGVNSRAFRRVKKALADGAFFCIAPEGTRSGSGVLQEGRSGAIVISHTTKTPIVPVGHFGGELVWENLRRLRRTVVRIRVGEPFCITNEGEFDAEVQKEITREVMYQIAALLPAPMRGRFSDLSAYRADHLQFLPVNWGGRS